MLTKAQLRNKILLRLKTQKEEQRKRKSSIIKDKLFKTRAFKKAKTVMFYIAFDGEVNTDEMIREAQRQGRQVAAPVCKKNRQINPCRLESGTRLIKGPYGTREPRPQKPIKLKDLELVVVPGVAFDKNGKRLGRGRGYYDRFLRRLCRKTATIGLAFDFQLLPSIPVTTEDVRVNRVIFA
jgi:5-formyltetrahydrofolate cyclo-ligase